MASSASLNLADARALLQGPGTTAQQQSLQELMVLMLQSQPSYFQVRLIAADQHGMERVRVDRGTQGPLVVAEDDLQEKGHFDYVSQTLQLGRDQTYMSRVAINHERGSHLGVDKPSLQLARPVRDAQGRALGVAVINIDLNGTFELLAKDLPESVQLYFANHEGDILIHPDSSKTFGFDKGRRMFIQDDFPATLPVVRGALDRVVFEARDGAHAQQPMVAAFMGQAVRVASAASVRCADSAAPAVPGERAGARASRVPAAPAPQARAGRQRGFPPRSARAALQSSSGASWSTPHRAPETPSRPTDVSFQAGLRGLPITAPAMGTTIINTSSTRPSRA